MIIWHISRCQQVENVRNPRIRLPFWADTFHPFVGNLWVIYCWVYYTLYHIYIPTKGKLNPTQLITLQWFGFPLRGDVSNVGITQPLKKQTWQFPDYSCQKIRQTKMMIQHQWSIFLGSMVMMHDDDLSAFMGNMCYSQNMVHGVWPSSPSSLFLQSGYVNFNPVFMHWWPSPKQWVYNPTTLWETNITMSENVHVTIREMGKEMNN